MQPPKQAGDESFLAGEFQALFRSQWAPWVGGLLLGLLNVLMFAYARPWGVADGVGNWGNWVLLGAGVNVGDQAAPWQQTTSVSNLSLVFGAMIAALLAGQFAFRMTPGRDLVRSLLGGILLGIGSTLGIGCTIGGFFSSFSANSLAGPIFMAGLFGGTYLGLRVLMWDLARETTTPKMPPPKAPNAPDWSAIQPWIGGLLLVATVAWLIFDQTTFTYRGITGQRSVWILLGIALGVVNQRTRFCFVRAFREPFMTGDGSMTRGAALALLVGLIGFSIIKGSELGELRRPEEFVNSSVWLGSLLGGLIFGFGMVLSGGCASGSLWRLGEGQMKFLLVLGAFAITNAALSFAIRTTNARAAWGDTRVFVPDLLGWPGAVLAMAAVAVTWYLLAAWNEKSEKLVV